MTTTTLPAWVSVAACLLLGAGGCSGSGDGDTGGPPNPPNPPTGDVTVTLTARDAFGEPVPDAEILLLNSSGTGALEVDTLTDVNGRVEIVGAFGDVYAASVVATNLHGLSYEPSRPANDQIDFEVTLHPSSALTGGVGQLSVTGTSPDGRRLEFSARLYAVEGNGLKDLNLEAWNLGGVGVLPCAADCVAGSAGLDAAFEGSVLRQKWVDPDPAPGPLALSLLLDQGEASP